MKKLTRGQEFANRISREPEMYKLPQHTPTPWGHAGAQLIGNEARETIGLLKNTDAGTDAQANAAFIVHVVNCHQELVNALKQALEDTPDIASAWSKRAEEAITKAEGK